MLKQKFKIVFILLLLTLFSCLETSKAEIVFEDNFDSTPDWHSNEGYGGAGDLQEMSEPVNWTSYYSSKRLFEDLSYNFEINNSVFRGDNGKSLICNYEPRNDWEGGRVVKWLGNDGYDDIIIRFSERFEEGYKIRTMYGSFLHKMFRLESNVDGPGDNYDPTNMYQTPTSRPEWDDPLYVQPWGPYMDMIQHFTLNGDISTSDMEIMVNESIDTTTSTGTFWIGDELFRYYSRDKDTKTFYVSTRGYGETPIGEHLNGAAISQSEFNLSSYNTGGKQAYVLFNYGVSVDHAGIVKFVFNPEGRAGSLSDMHTDFDDGKTFNWNDYFAQQVIGSPGDFPWGAHNADGYDYQGNGQWVTWDVHAKMNTVGQEDGYVKIYINGSDEPVVQKTGLALRKSDITKFNLLAIPDNMYNMIYYTFAGKLYRTGGDSVNPTYSISKTTESVEISLNNNGSLEWTNVVSLAESTLADLLSGMPSEWYRDGGVTKWSQSEIPVENLRTSSNVQGGETQTYTYIPTEGIPPGMSDTQQFSIDDVIVYTPMSGTEGACSDGCTDDGRLPLGYVINSVLGDLNSPNSPSGLNII